MLAPTDPGFVVEPGGLPVGVIAVSLTWKSPHATSSIDQTVSNPLIVQRPTMNGYRITATLNVPLLTNLLVVKPAAIVALSGTSSPWKYPDADSVDRNDTVIDPVPCLEFMNHLYVAWPSCSMYEITGG
jgi:hypothetical protein